MIGDPALSPEQCYAAWTPPAVPWIPWAKPTLFASQTVFLAGESVTIATPDVAGFPESWETWAAVLDLPDDESVRLGVGLIERGFWPVPLFDGTSGPIPVIDNTRLVTSLGAVASVLTAASPRPEMRPAFLLDSRRYDESGANEPGRYDNRWIVLPQSFPSATLLASRGIKGVVLIQRSSSAPRRDLAHVLRRWHDGGLRLRGIDLATGQVTDPLHVDKPSSFRHLWYTVIALMGLRRNNVGGFGATIPHETQGRYG